MMQIVLFLAAVSLVSYLIPVALYLVRPKKPTARERPVSRRTPRIARLRAHAGNEALERMVQMVEEERASPEMPEPEMPGRSDKVVKLR